MAKVRNKNAKGNQRRSGTKEKPPRIGCPVVGIGASAGGIDALKKFLPGIEPGSGLAFVVVQHLDPHHSSVLAEVLARSSRLPVVSIKDGMVIEADHIYVIPPNATLSIEGSELRVARPSAPRGARNPIDTFFVSLAEAQAENAACVILSGTGSDGTLGLRAVKEHGGLTLAQAGAQYDGMMRSALATRLVDFVLPAEEMPERLANYFRHIVEIGEKKGIDGVQQEAANRLAQICTILRARTGHDFSGYKDKTLTRRVQRRMQVLQLTEVDQFLERLRQDPHEVDMLFQDLLIGVTNFFRDPQVFKALESEVIPRLFERKGPDDSVRVWVPGCSTGEEAYSIAILLREHAPKSHSIPKLQVFASDIDEAALEVARFGRYPSTIARDVSARRLERFFLREDGSYRVGDELREICLFSVHNILRDAPFSRLDLISCRNLLIYLNAELQSRIVPLLHYALRNGGYLLLGTSENVTRHPRLFAAVDKPNRIFQRRPPTERRLPEFPLSTPDAAGAGPAQMARAASPDTSLKEMAERQLLERYAPAYAVVTAEGELLHTSGRTGKYLELPAGAPVANIFSLARRGLRLDLRAALHKAIKSGQPTVQSRVSVATDGGAQELDLLVQPLRPSAAQDSLYMIVFQDLGGIRSAEAEAGEHAPDDEAAVVRQLEAELRATKERLQTTTEELESANEELKSGNEELSSINEELQSANEELETSKEELQSINEELQTVNAELNARVEELSRANSDIANLLESTQIATVFLDREMRVKSFTPAAKELFRLVESDTGRPIMDVRTRFDLDSVQPDAERVLRSLETIEKQVDSSETHKRYIMRLLPYRTVDNVIAGVVVTFTDITRIAAAEARIGELSLDLRNRLENLETLVDLVPVGIFIVDNRAQKIRANRYAARLLGEDGGGRGLREISSPLQLFEGERELALQEQPLQHAARTGEAVPDREARLRLANGSFIDVLISATPLFDESGKVRGAIGAVIDISQRKRVEAYQQVLLDELQHRVKNVLATISSLAARMLKDKPDGRDFAQAFTARLNAMAAMHDLLSQRGWEGADLRNLVERALAAYRGSGKASISIEGPDVLLWARTATTLGMVVHELATNAAKYGALKAAQGRVAVSWNLSGSGTERRLRISWMERDGPSVRPPAHDGFGASFIKRSVEYELEGRAQLDFEPGGLHCVIEIPLQSNREPSGGPGKATQR